MSVGARRAAAVGYAVTIMAMAATPLAMLGCGCGCGCGARRVMQVGFLLLVGHALIAASGVTFLPFVSALALLGVGWLYDRFGWAALNFAALPPLLLALG